MECLKYTEFYYYFVKSKTHMYSVNWILQELCNLFGEKYDLYCEGPTQADLFRCLFYAHFNIEKVISGQTLSAPHTLPLADLNSYPPEFSAKRFRVKLVSQGDILILPQFLGLAVAAVCFSQ